MESVEFRGNESDLGRFAQKVLKRSVAIAQPSRFEQQIRWDFGDRSGFGSALRSSSGIKMSSAWLRWAEPWAFRTREVATPLKFMLGRGAGPRVTLANGAQHVLGAGNLQVRHSTETVESTLEFERGAQLEQLSLEIEPAKLRELLGAATLPAPLAELLSSGAPSAAYEQRLSPALFRLMDEILYADARAASRQLLLEAKGLELLAVLIDELALAGEAASPLCEWDIERLERARCVLLARLASPPSLPELARSVGLNEFKLKQGFRTLFGTTVFGYLRVQRMEHARRLLAQRGLNVTEVSQRVGYENPSKFAAAFRKHFGFPPSAVR